MSNAEVKSCEECGASIYPEHLQTHKAGYWGGRLVCVHCYNEHRDQQVTIDPQDFAHSTPVAAQAAAAVSPPPGEPPADSLSLIEDLEAEIETAGPASRSETPILLASTPAASISTFGNTSLGGSSKSDDPDQRFKRPLQHDGKGATRCRIFHAKLNDGALRFMQENINDWIDGHADVEIKYANTQVGVVEGKSQEPHLIVTVFY